MEAETIGRALELLRQELFLTQGKAGKRSDPPVARQQISRYENGEEHPTWKTLVRYVSGLGRKLADLEQIGDLLEAGRDAVEIIELRGELRKHELGQGAIIDALLRLREYETEYEFTDELVETGES